MRQILNNAGYECEKQFVYGNLRASTGTCCVSWVYHVAILVSFKNASGVVEKRIIDPSWYQPVLSPILHGELHVPTLLADQLLYLLMLILQEMFITEIRQDLYCMITTW
jgi:hypothetical protein